MLDLAQVVADTISGIIKNSPWFVLFYIGFKAIAKEVRVGIKQIPHWIKQLHENNIKEINMQRAMEAKRSY